MFFTEANVKIDKQIEKGLTRLFLDSEPHHVLNAEAYAKQKRSYVYPVFAYEDRKSKRVQVGLAVPN